MVVNHRLPFVGGECIDERLDFTQFVVTFSQVAALNTVGTGGKDLGILLGKLRVGGKRRIDDLAMKVV